MKKIKKMLFIQSRACNRFPDDELEIIFGEFDYKSDEFYTYVTLGTTEVEVEIDDATLKARMVNAQIDALQSAKIKILADSQVKANNIAEQIQKLQALECK